MYEQIINSVIDFSILIMEGFLAFYLLSEMLPTMTTEVSAASVTTSNDGIIKAEDIIAPTLTEAQALEIVEAIPQGLNLSVKQLKLIAKQHKIKGYAGMCKSKLQEALMELELGFRAQVLV